MFPRRKALPGMFYEYSNEIELSSQQKRARISARVLPKNMRLLHPHGTARRRGSTRDNSWNTESKKGEKYGAGRMGAPKMVY